MKAVLINPNLVVQASDPFTTGIVYMPIGLASIAAALRKNEIPLHVIDAYAEKPKKVRREGQFLLFGLDYNEVVNQIQTDATIVFLYCINLTNFHSTIEILKAVKKARPQLPVVVVENTQAVTAYSLRAVASEFYNAGADFILTGEGEYNAVTLTREVAAGTSPSALSQIPGVGIKNFDISPTETIANLDALSFPAWDLFPIKNYWQLRLAHGPFSTKRYLPLLTSRGCPYPCRFCVVPETNKQKWRSRSAANVVDEMEHYVRTFHVREFHIEDLNPTISDHRIQEICREIINRRLNVIWKIAAGTKVESIKTEETIDLMAQAGCRYISISPETGSPRLLKLIQKPFNISHAVKLVHRMNKVGIRSQACFVLGFPGENEEDRKMTWNLVHDLTKQGVDEIALFIITPVPGSAIYDQFQGYESFSELNFTPSWREDFKKLNHFRLSLYRNFLFWKLRYHPLKMMKQPIQFLRRSFETKMEMAPYRALVVKWLSRNAATINRKEDERQHALHAALK